MAIIYSKKQLIQRIQRHMNNGFPDTDFKTSANEILLYIDSALAFSIVGKAYEGAKVEGALVAPEAFYLTSSLPALVQDQNTGYWTTTLPQPPLTLPLGYSINRMYFASTTDGVSQSIMPIKAKRVSYRMNMPLPSGVRYWVEGSKVFLQANEGQSLLGQTVYATMLSSRTNDVNDTMNVADDVLEAIFNTVVGKIKDRMAIPTDIVKDNLPAGNKSS